LDILVDSISSIDLSTVILQTKPSCSYVDRHQSGMAWTAGIELVEAGDEMLTIVRGCGCGCGCGCGSGSGCSWEWGEWWESVRAGERVDDGVGGGVHRRGRR